MRTARRLIAGCLLFIGAGIFSGLAAQANHFPKLSAERPDRKSVELPAAFTGNRNLVILRFMQEQQSDADGWLAEAKTLHDQHATFDFYEVEVLPKRNILYRWWLSASTSSHISDPVIRERTFNIYGDATAIRKQLSIPTDKTIAVLLLDKNAQVLWQSSGPLDDTKKHALEGAVQ
jgi:hypothetical protein